jgi:hypothetical protein
MREILRSAVIRVWLPVLGAASVVASLDRGTDPGDLIYFVHRGEALLSHAWADTFADPKLQSGPLQLVVFGAVRHFGALALLLEVGVAALLLFVLGRVGVGDRARLAVGLVAVAVGFTHGAFVDGHPAEAVTPLLWVLAGVWAREDRVLRGGALIGLSAGFELWGVLGVPVLLLAPRLRRAVVGGAVTAGVVIAQLAPFVLAGEFRMFEHEWHVATGTLLSLFVDPGTDFGWPLRLLQSSLALACGAGIALAARRSVHAVWLVPLGVVLVRLLLDPLSFGWYWLEAEALVLVGAALLVRPLQTRVVEARRARAAGRPRPAVHPLPPRS